MNSEKFKELAEQAGFQYIKDENIGWAGNYNSSLPKFAELIVKECAEIAGCNIHVSGFALGDLMKDRFGIEDE